MARSTDTTQPCSKNHKAGVFRLEHLKQVSLLCNEGGPSAASILKIKQARSYLLTPMQSMPCIHTTKLFSAPK